MGADSGPPGGKTSEGRGAKMLRIAKKSWVLSAARNMWHTVVAERQVIFRTDGTVRHIRISRVAHVLALVVFMGGVGWTTFSSTAYFTLRDTLQERDAELVRRADSYKQLTHEVSESRSRFFAIASALERNHSQLVGVIGQNQALLGDIASLRGKLKTAENQQRQTVQTKEKLTRQLSSLEGKVVEAENRSAALADTLQSATSQLSNVLAQKTEEESRGDQMKSRVTRLQARLSDVRQSQESLLGRITDATISDIKRAENIIKQTGLSVERLIKSRTPPQGASGGPFIPLNAPASGPFELSLTSIYTHMDRWETLQRAVQHLPLVSPVEQYYVASRFGRRRDPINKRWAVHKGLDLAGPAGQKVRSPAMGRVVYAGNKGLFGRFIEIDHGAGIRTRYGHLRRVLVKRGQRVTRRQEIGILGSSGRSTGPHVHFEILVNGRQVNPAKFLKAGRGVFQG